MTLRPDNLISDDEAVRLGIKRATITQPVKSRSNQALKPPAPSRETRRPWLNGILARLGFKDALGPEDTISAELADRLAEAEHEGRSRSVWTHVPNEGKRGRAYSAKLAHLGMVGGAPDWWFAWSGGSGVIELKAPRGAKAGADLLRYNQAEFRAWCVHHGVRHAICTSAEDAWRTLVEWGAVSDG